MAKKNSRNARRAARAVKENFILQSGPSYPPQNDPDAPRLSFFLKARQSGTTDALDAAVRAVPAGLDIEPNAPREELEDAAERLALAAKHFYGTNPLAAGTRLSFSTERFREGLEKAKAERKQRAKANLSPGVLIHLEHALRMAGFDPVKIGFSCAPLLESSGWWATIFLSLDCSHRVEVDSHFTNDPANGALWAAREVEHILRAFPEFGSEKITT